MFKSSDVAILFPPSSLYWKPSNFNKISLIFGIGYGFRFNCSFRLLYSHRKRTIFDLGLSWTKYGDPHFESFATSSNPSGTKRSNSFLKISSCKFVTGYGPEHIGCAPSFNLNYNGYFSRCQVFHQTTIRILVIILAVHYVVLLSNFDIEFP